MEDYYFPTLRANLSSSSAETDFLSHQNLWKTITFAAHTEGKPKLKFKEEVFSKPPDLMENNYSYSPIPRVNLKLKKADFLSLPKL